MVGPMPTKFKHFQYCRRAMIEDERVRSTLKKYFKCSLFYFSAGGLRLEVNYLLEGGSKACREGAASPRRAFNT